jgi:hypothetical protein
MGHAEVVSVDDQEFGVARVAETFGDSLLTISLPGHKQYCEGKK